MLDDSIFDELAKLVEDTYAELQEQGEETGRREE